MNASRLPVPAPRQRARRWLRWAGRLVLVLLTLTGLCLGVLLLRPLREPLLAWGLPGLLAGLPGGGPRVVGLTWPRLGRLELERVLWVVEGDTLLSAGAGVVDVELAPLLKRDLRLREARLGALSLDLPSLRRILSRGASPASKPRRWLRTGAWAPLPSLACAVLDLRGGPLRLDSLRRLERFEIRGGLELGAGREAALWLDSLWVRQSGPTAELSSGGLRLEPVRGVFSGRLAVRADPGWLADAELRTVGRDGLRALVSISDTGHQVLRLDLRAQLQRQGSSWPGARVEGQLTLAGMADLRRVPKLERLLKWAPELEPLDAGLALDLAWSPRLDLRLVLRAEPGTWLEGVFVQASSQGSGIRLDSLDLRSPGLSLAGHARLDPDSLHAALRAELKDSTGLRFLPGARALPRDLRAWLALRVETPRTSRGGTGRLSLRAETGSLRLLAAARGAWPALFTLDTLQVLDLLEPSAAGNECGGGRVARDARGRWSAAPLVLAGVLGRWEVSGLVDSLGSGTFTLDGWLAGLSPSAGRVCRVPDDLAGTLDLALAGGAPARLVATGHFERAGHSTRLSAAGELRLPGPRRLAALLPAGARLDGLEDLEAGWTLAWMGGGQSRWWATLSGRAAGWLDSLACVLNDDGSRLRLEGGLVRMSGLAFDLEGERRGRDLDLQAAWSLENTTLLSRFQPALTGARARLTGTLHLQGPAEDPRLDLTAAGSWRQGGFALPELQVTARRDSLGLAAVIRATGGLLVGGLWLDTLTARYDGPPGAALLFPGRVWLRAGGAQGFAEADLVLRRDAGWRVEGRRLSLGAGEAGLETRRPFWLTLPASGGLRLDSLDMAGSLGQLQAAAWLSADSLGSRVTLRADLAPRTLPWPGALPPDLRPGRARLELDAAGATGLQASLVLDDLRGLSGPPMEFRLELAGPLRQPGLAAWVTGKGDTLLLASGRLPAELHLWPPGLTARLQPLALDLTFDHFPVPLSNPVEGRDGTMGQLDGTLVVNGSGSAPQLHGDLRVTAPQSRQLGGYEGALTLDWNTPAGAPSVLTGEVELSREGRRLATGQVRLPAHLADAGGLVLGDLDTELHAVDLPLEDLNTLLPEHLWLKGTGGLDLSARGPARNPLLAGRAVVKSVDLRRSDGTHLFGQARLTLAGRLAHPLLNGWVELENGDLRLPKVTRNLHPASGQALLWNERIGTPSLAVANQGDGPGWLDSLELDLDLRIPNRLRVRGGDLDLECRGHLTLSRRIGRNALLGDLQVLAGEFRLLGRRFIVQSGTMTWYGDESLSPRLDLDLAATVGDARVMVRLTGTLEEPRLELSSDPPMEQGEIMALLLFRRPADELDNQQQGILQRQAAQLATDYGMTALQTGISRSLGLDMVRWEATGADWQGTLLVGKYVGPRILVYYEQSLSQQDLFRLHVDYVISRRLRLDTSTGTLGQSGVTLTWSRIW